MAKNSFIAGVTVMVVILRTLIGDRFIIVIKTSYCNSCFENSTGGVLKQIFILVRLLLRSDIFW